MIWTPKPLPVIASEFQIGPGVSKWNCGCALNRNAAIIGHRIFNNLRQHPRRQAACSSKGMSFWLILLTAQVVVMLFAVVRESGKDKRFEGEKLGFRS